MPINKRCDCSRHHPQDGYQFDRRDFIKVGGALTGGAFVAWLSRRLGGGPNSSQLCSACVNSAQAQGVLDHRVVHVHAPSATYWDYGDNYYGNYVDQQVVNEMVDRGVMELTGAVTTGEAWQMLVPVYNPGQTSIAIKVNMNNNFHCEVCETGCEDWQLQIDAVIHPINAVIQGLESAYPNLEYSDIWVYDATIGPNPPVSHRQIPKRFTDACLYSGVRFFDQGCNESAAFTSSDPTANIEWSNPAGIPTPPDQKLTDVLLNATYLINMPILKGHGGTGVSLSAKNHFGSIDNCPPLHEWVYLDQPNYSSEYSPLIDIYRNPHIEGKTVLIIGDGLFGDRRGNTNKPSRWDTFGGNASNSLFFSVDPVAIDCVMLDLLSAESGINSNSEDYLRLADEAGIGLFERGDPWQEPFGSGYSSIEYIRLTEPYPPATTFVDVPRTHWAYSYIEALYQAGFVVGCSLEPRLYCPDQFLTRAESSVFIMRGAYGTIPDPPYTPPGTPTFTDVSTGFWGYGWIESLWQDGYTAGCNTDPLMYCPLSQHTRAEACVFFMRIMNGVDYQPPAPSGVFDDVPLNAWYAGWVEAAYNHGLLPECGTNPLSFCPDAPLDRAWAAYMMCIAKSIQID